MAAGQHKPGIYYDGPEDYGSGIVRLFMHFYFRTIVNGIGPAESDPEAGYLKDDDSWLLPYYQPNTPKYKERLYFAGLDPF